MMWPTFSNFLYVTLAFRVGINSGKLEMCTALGAHHWGMFLLARGLKELDGIVLPAEDLARTTVEHPLSRQQDF